MPLRDALRPKSIALDAALVAAFLVWQSIPAFSAKVGEEGKLFGSVTAGDIVAAIKKAGGPNLDKRTVHLPKAHIKSVGTHAVEVRLHPSVNATVSVDVVSE